MCSKRSRLDEAVFVAKRPGGNYKIENGTTRRSNLSAGSSLLQNLFLNIPELRDNDIHITTNRNEDSKSE